MWDYPRPPRVERCSRHLRVVHAGRSIADTTSAFRVVETASPPTFYLPRADCDLSVLRAGSATSLCEWKGHATYWDLAVGAERVTNAAWSYPEPWAGFEQLAGNLAFFAGRLDECWIDDERVQPQPGDFYGGWVTREILGPFKGDPGTEGW